MSATKLAILGGDPIRKNPFRLRKTINQNEMKAVMEVMEKGDISLFFGSPGDYFLGGPHVKKFENQWASKFGFKHCVSVNSWTTGLMTAVGAVGIGPGDEVICTPYSMSATATSILFYGGIPVFVDIEDETFCIDPKKIEAKITPRTKAIMLTHLFGHPADMDEIMRIACKHNLKVIEDAAHAPGAKYKGRYVGAIGDIGGFSFNYHKHIHSGEGGLIVTQDPDLALRCQLIRNHGENCVEAYDVKDISNMIGSNYRLTELQAAIGATQTEYINGYVEHRNVLAAQFSQALSQYPCFQPPVIKDGCTHSFYTYSFQYDETVFGVSRAALTKAINAELPKPESWEQLVFVEGYVKPLYWSPVYQQQIALGNKGFPWTLNHDVRYDYSRGICPVVEKMHLKSLLYTPLIREAVTTEDIKDLIRAVDKVMSGIESLKTNDVG